jgi:peroxiredoxin
LLQQVAENYRHLRSFEFAGHLTAEIPGSNLRVTVETLDAEAGRRFIPSGSPLLRYGEARSFQDVKVTDAEQKDVPSAPIVRMPSHWAFYEQINMSIKTAAQLPAEVLQINGAPMRCDVVEVSYDREKWSPEELTVKYWISQESLLVLKEEFAERQGHQGAPPVWHWLYTVDSIKLNQPPSNWLIDFATQHVDRARPEWVDREAPDFTLLDLDGHSFNLSSVRGQVVLLDFWATWCGPCREEMPVVETIRADYAAKGVEVWGVSDQPPSTVKEWLTRNQRKLPTLIDGDRTASSLYQIEGIPTLIVINRAGKVASYYFGREPEQILRSAIETALAENSGRKVQKSADALTAGLTSTSPDN